MAGAVVEAHAKKRSATLHPAAEIPPSRIPAIHAVFRAPLFLPPHKHWGGRNTPSRSRVNSGDFGTDVSAAVQTVKPYQTQRQKPAPGGIRCGRELGLRRSRGGGSD